MLSQNFSYMIRKNWFFCIVLVLAGFVIGIWIFKPPGDYDEFELSNTPGMVGIGKPGAMSRDLSDLIARYMTRDEELRRCREAKSDGMQSFCVGTKIGTYFYYWLPAGYSVHIRCDSTAVATRRASISGYVKIFAENGPVLNGGDTVTMPGNYYFIEKKIIQP
jgi:hypothetical protein